MRTLESAFRITSSIFRTASEWVTSPKCTKPDMKSRVLPKDIVDEVYAIKIVELSSLRSKKLEELLFSEIGILKKLNHPNVLRCHEVFTSNRHCYIITELCNGGDLETKLKKNGPFSEKEA